MFCIYCVSHMNIIAIQRRIWTFRWTISFSLFEYFLNHWRSSISESENLKYIHFITYLFRLPEGRNCGGEASSSERWLQPASAESSKPCRETTLRPGRDNTTTILDTYLPSLLSTETTRTKESSSRRQRMGVISDSDYITKTDPAVVLWN